MPGFLVFISTFSWFYRVFRS